MHHEHDEHDERDERDEREDPRRDEPTQFQDKSDPDTRPDAPTPSDDATLVERGEGAHAEYAEAPETMRDNPPPSNEGASGG